MNVTVAWDNNFRKKMNFTTAIGKKREQVTCMHIDIEFA